MGGGGGLSHDLVRSVTPVFAQFQNLYDPMHQLGNSINGGVSNPGQDSTNSSEMNGLFGPDAFDYGAFGTRTGGAETSE